MFTEFEKNLIAEWVAHRWLEPMGIYGRPNKVTHWIARQIFNWAMKKPKNGNSFPRTALVYDFKQLREYRSVYVDSRPRS